MVLGALAEDPRITSFAVARDPEIEKETSEKIPDLFQPVLMLRDGQKTEKAAKEMARCRAPQGVFTSLACAR